MIDWSTSSENCDLTPISTQCAERTPCLATPLVANSRRCCSVSSPRVLDCKLWQGEDQRRPIMMRYAPISLLLSTLAAGTVLAQGGNYSVRTLPLPDNNAGDVSMDYIAYDPGTNSVWVPGGNTGAVDVVDAATGKVRQILGFATRTVESPRGKRVFGPTAVSIGEGVVYIGNRGDSTICEFNSTSLARGACGHLDSTPDGVAYVAQTREVWVTTPGDKSIRVLDGKTLDQKTKLTFDG